MFNAKDINTTVATDEKAYSVSGIKFIAPHTCHRGFSYITIANGRLHPASLFLSNSNVEKGHKKSAYYMKYTAWTITKHSCNYVAYLADFQ